MKKLWFIVSDRCKRAADDYSRYLHWLGEALAESECVLHAYVLMTSHVHLLVTPKKAEAIPQLMIFLGRHYVQYYGPASVRRSLIALPRCMR